MTFGGSQTSSFQNHLLRLPPPSASRSRGAPGSRSANADDDDEAIVGRESLFACPGGFSHTTAVERENHIVFFDTISVNQHMRREE